MLSMRTILFMSAALLAIFASFSLAEPLAATPVSLDPTITPAPKVPIELLRRQNNARFMGWLSVSGTWSSQMCDLGGTYYQSGEYWRCCATTNNGCSNVPIGCISGSLIYTYTSGTLSRGTYACTSIYTAASDSSFTICNSGFLYENTGDSSPLTNIFCGVSSVVWSYYRQSPAGQTSTTPSSTPSSTPRSTSPSPTAPLQTVSQNPTPQSGKKSNAWIAGAVVGPVVGLALLGALAWFCLSRRKKDKTTVQPNQPPMQQQPGVPTPHPPPSYQGSPQMNPPAPQYYDAHKQPNATPYGVATQNSWAPQSPTTQGSHSPQPPQSPYGPPPGQQQWQQNQPQSPPPKDIHAYTANANQQPGVNERHFSAELDSGPYQSIPQHHQAK